MHMTLKIKPLLILMLCLGLSACAINTPLALQNSQGELQGNQLFIGKSFTLDAGNKIKGDIVGIGTDLTLEPGSMVEGNILLIGSSLELGGIVKGDLNLFAGNSHLIKSAILNGDINQFFHHIILEPDAQVTGEMNSFSFPGFPAEQISGFISTAAEWVRPNRWFLWDCSRTLVLSLLALLAVMLLKKSTLRISAQIQSQPFIAWGAGIIIALVTPFLALILIITICLLPIGLLILLALALSYLFGWLALGIVMGKLVDRWLRTHWSDELQAFLGSLMLGLITSIIGWIPCIGWIFNIMIGCIGLGAAIITRFGVLAPQGNLISDPIVLVDEPPRPSEIKPPAEKPEKTRTKSKK
jgi:uncharacterized membrane protein